MVAAGENDFVAAIIIQVEQSGRNIDLIATGSIRESGQPLAFVGESVQKPRPSRIAIRHDNLRFRRAEQLPYCDGAHVPSAAAVLKAGNYLP